VALSSGAVEAGAVPELRPLSLGEILDVAIKIYLRNAWTLFRVVLFVVAPVQVVTALIDASAASNGNGVTTTGDTTTISSHDFAIYASALVAAGLLGIVASTLANGACFKAVADAYLGEQPTWRSSLRFAFARVHSILWITFLGGLCTVIGFVFCIIPGIYLWIAFAVAVPVLLTEGVKGTSALGRSRALVRGRWWGTFGVVLLGTILAGIVSAAIGGLAGLAAGTTDANTVAGFLVNSVSGTLGSMISTPFTAAFVTVLYFDLRVRKEAFDLQLLAERIGLTAPPEGGYRPAPGPAPAPRPTGGAAPPYWPPPPGWTPPES
jgi:hypothetical protein